MRFQVPQFIEIESKIFGPLTFKQFIYLAGGGGRNFPNLYNFAVFYRRDADRAGWRFRYRPVFL